MYNFKELFDHELSLILNDFQKEVIYSMDNDYDKFDWLFSIKSIKEEDYITYLKIIETFAKNDFNLDKELFFKIERVSHIVYGSSITKMIVLDILERKIKN